MNRELMTIIESLCHRVEFTNHSGLTFIEMKPELCRITSLRQPARCHDVDCPNCYFTRSHHLDKVYTLYLERLIQRM